MVILATKWETSARNRWLPLVFHVALPYTWPSILPAKANTLLPPWRCLLTWFTRVGRELVGKDSPDKSGETSPKVAFWVWSFWGFQNQKSVLPLYTPIASHKCQLWVMAVLNNGGIRFPAQFWTALRYFSQLSQSDLSAQLIPPCSSS